jgi:TetR/AcrR family fatty acid metabolism transcriptional regulator
VSETPDVRAERRRRILDAAVKVFAAQGHHATRIQDIADEAGVAYGLVYHYFGTKDALLSTVFDENWAIFAEVVEGIAASGRPPDQQVRTVLDYVFGALDAYPDRMRVILLEYGRLAGLGTALEHAEVRRVLAVLRATFDHARAEGLLVDGARPDALPVMILGALHAAIVGTMQATEPVPVDAVRSTVLSLFRGVLRTSKEA